MSSKRGFNREESVHRCSYCSRKCTVMWEDVFCTPECYLGFHLEFASYLYNACYSQVVARSRPTDEMPKPAPRRNQNVHITAASYWRAVIPRLYADEFSSRRHRLVDYLQGTNADQGFGEEEFTLEDELLDHHDGMLDSDFTTSASGGDLSMMTTCTKKSGMLDKAQQHQKRGRFATTGA